MNPTKTTESNEVLFAAWTQVGPRNNVLVRGPHIPEERAILGEDITQPL